MFFKFLNRFLTTNKSSTETIKQTYIDTTLFATAATTDHSYFFPNFKLFYHDTYITIDLLLFFPNRGIYLGETLDWTYEYLKNSTLERSSKRSEKTSTTHLEKTTHIVNQKLQDVLSFDSTPIYRFLWLPHLSESDFDLLDNSFHTLLPKPFILFKDETTESVLTKLHTLAAESEAIYSPIKVLGALQPHTLLLPDVNHPFGRFLSDEQIEFIHKPIEKKLVQLHGDFGSGKSTLLTRKILTIYLENRDKKIIIITPSRLSGELLKDELIALIEYSILSLPLSAFNFYLPEQIASQEFEKSLQDASVLICDDTNRISKQTIDQLLTYQSTIPMLLSVNEPVIDSDIYRLYKQYHNNARHFLIHTTQDGLLGTFLSDLRKRLSASSPSEILVVLEADELISTYQEAIIEYLECECRTITPEFSLQYQNMDALLLSVPECLSGLSVPHLYLIGNVNETMYPFILSRASETVTIITPSKV